LTEVIDFIHTPSSEIDDSLGFRIRPIEKMLFELAKSLRPDGNLNNLGSVLHQGNQTWIGLEPETLQTPYAELREVLEILKPLKGQRIVDLGAGYGRMGIILHFLYPGVHFLGIEFVPERVNEGARVFRELNADGELLQGDLTHADFVLPKANYYFIYDFGKVSHIRRTLKQIENAADEQKIVVIARGAGVRSIIDHEHPWLSGVHGPIHREKISIYFS